MTNTVEQRQRDIADEFSMVGDWMERYQYLVQLGRMLESLPDADKTDANLIRGCQSQVWLAVDDSGDTLRFRGGSDAAIVQGLVALALRVYSDAPAAEIATTEPQFIHDIGLSQHLSPTRSNGLHSLMQRIRAEAAARA
ncbi:SufE family protein [Litorivicinus lipolyticus]|jgi:cysteine desulfuration protein SufE|uniref:SufE family protein n=1 Tax=Litorivicinus lipolyticus TaxID=418701 RepID=A0A5Q2QGP4_9GAMM|nr:SufE family protein [Litorivicinus lipolyticus]QGG81186.1 SufE family protein [Litorivicinus lipolyticus]